MKLYPLFALVVLLTPVFAETVPVYSNTGFQMTEEQFLSLTTKDDLIQMDGVIQNNNARINQLNNTLLKRDVLFPFTLMAMSIIINTIIMFLVLNRFINRYRKIIEKAEKLQQQEVKITEVK